MPDSPARFQPVHRRSLKELVAKELRDDILAGRFVSGQLPSVRSLAERFGVSTMTVFGAQQDLEKEGLLETRPTVGTFVRAEAVHKLQPQAGRQVRNILMFSRLRRPQDMKETYYSEIWDGLLTAAADLGHRVTAVYLPSGGELQAVTQTLADIPAHGGVLLGMPSRDLTERILATGLPMVLADHHFPDMAVDAVDSDSESGSVLAVQHLVGLGHRKIGYINNLKPDYNPDRYNGYLKGMAQAGLEVEQRFMLRGIPTEDGGYAAASTFIKSSRDLATAFVVYGGIMAVGAIAAFRAHGLRVPEDVSVIGSGNRWFSDVYPWVTAVIVNAHRLGYEALQLLAKRLEYPERPTQTMLLPMDLLQGETTPRTQTTN